MPTINFALLAETLAAADVRLEHFPLQALSLASMGCCLERFRLDETSPGIRHVVMLLGLIYLLLSFLKGISYGPLVGTLTFLKGL